MLTSKIWQFSTSHIVKGWEFVAWLLVAAELGKPSTDCNISSLPKVKQKDVTVLDFPSIPTYSIPRWWFQIFFIFTPTWGRLPFWRSYFSNGLVQPPTRSGFQDVFSIVTLILLYDVGSPMGSGTVFQRFGQHAEAGSMAPLHRAGKVEFPRVRSESLRWSCRECWFLPPRIGEMIWNDPMTRAKNVGTPLSAAEPAQPCLQGFSLLGLAASWQWGWLGFGSSQNTPWHGGNGEKKQLKVGLLMVLFFFWLLALNDGLLFHLQVEFFSTETELLTGLV